MSSGVGGAGSPGGVGGVEPRLKSAEPRPMLGEAESRRPEREARLRQATREFEAVFIQEMLKAMRSTVPEGGLVDAGQSEDMFSALLDEHVARASADRGEGGLAEALYRQFIGRLGA